MVFDEENRIGRPNLREAELIKEINLYKGEMIKKTSEITGLMRKISALQEEIKSLKN